MQDDIGEVEAERPRSEELGIQDQRKPSERNPVGVVNADKAPPDILVIEAGEDMRVAGDVDGVIQVHKAQSERSSVNGERNAGKTSGQNKRMLEPFAGSVRHAGRPSANPRFLCF